MGAELFGVLCNISAWCGIVCVALLTPTVCALVEDAKEIGVAFTVLMIISGLASLCAGKERSSE